jgi:hypothetical protein
MVLDRQDTHVHSTANTNGQSAAHELFALTDEQILEIEPEARDVQVSREQAPATGKEAAAVAPRLDPGRGSSASVQQEESRTEASLTQNPGAERAAQPLRESGQARVAVPQEPPEWLAQRMKDPWNGEEAREFWQEIQQGQQEAAAYREVFAKPEEARTAADRARTLDDIDRAYFGAAGNSIEQTSAARAQLAARMMREDPAAFREMVLAGLRALEQSGAQAGSDVGSRFSATSAGADSGPTQTQGGLKSAPANAPAHAQAGTQGADHDARLAAYASFEKAANEDLERAVGVTIERTLEQALPNLARDAKTSALGAQHAAPLQVRLSQAIRQDVEAALKGDRQLGEQVAQILSGKRLDNETRAQVVRLIGERAQHLVPTAAKRVLNDWTQTTLTAHRGKAQRAEAVSARREVAPASPESRRASATAGPARASSRETVSDSTRSAPRPRGVDYRKLSDEQILEL